MLEEALGLAATIPDPAVAASATRQGAGEPRAWPRTGGATSRPPARGTNRPCAPAARTATSSASSARCATWATSPVTRTTTPERSPSYRECLTLLGERGDPLVVVNALAGAALAAAAWGQPERAARLLGAAEAVRERFRVGVDLPAERAAHERAVALVRAALGEEDLRAAWAAGRGLPLADGDRRGADPGAARGRRRGTVDRPSSGLSPREEEVLRLLVAGQSDREIAAALFISVRTAEGHVSRLLAKLEAPSRADAVRIATASGLTAGLHRPK